MNPWTQLSIDYANQRSYLDDLFKIYPTIPDGVLYIKGNNKMYRDITTKHKKENIMSSLLLREFLYQL